jgi:hypothetical protein
MFLRNVDPYKSHTASCTRRRHSSQSPPWKSQILHRRMASSGMLRRVALVRTDVSEELSASIIMVTRIGELGTTLATRRNIPEDTILHSHRSENLKSYRVSQNTENITHVWWSIRIFRNSYMGLLSSLPEVSKIVSETGSLPILRQKWEEGNYSAGSVRNSQPRSCGQRFQKGPVDCG